ncbi:aa3-type cytochrome c oxidase subunit IV [Yunchengibacter salinarum]
MTMETTDHQKTYKGFLKASKWGLGFVLVILLILASIA